MILHQGMLLEMKNKWSLKNLPTHPTQTHTYTLAFDICGDIVFTYIRDLGAYTWTEQLHT